MKKFLSFACAILMLAALTACGNNSSGNTGTPSSADKSSAPPAATQTPEETLTPDTAPNENASPEGTGRALVAYFSATGNTEGVAQIIASHLGADTYEIVPEAPYTETDLDYNTDCRANREQDDASVRPAISGSVENMEDYDVVFLGYPIWWGIHPHAHCLVPGGVRLFRQDDPAVTALRRRQLPL